nr:hypothetical protein GCM10020063_009350 [Dactylosporangium thailandense]
MLESQNASLKKRVAELESASPTRPSTAPSPTYSAAYQRQHLRAETPGCVDNGNFTTGIDFDEPRADAASDRTDVRLSGCNPGSLNSSLTQAAVPSVDATPADCLEQVRTQPVHLPIAAAKGLVLCFVTDSKTAASQGVKQKIVFMSLDSVTAQGDRGVFDLTLTAWNVP